MNIQLLKALRGEGMNGVGFKWGTALDVLRVESGGARVEHEPVVGIAKARVLAVRSSI